MNYYLETQFTKNIEVVIEEGQIDKMIDRLPTNIFEKGLECM